MAGTGDKMIRDAEAAATAATNARIATGKAQATPGHEARLKEAERAEATAIQAAKEARSRWG